MTETRNASQQPTVEYSALLIERAASPESPYSVIVRVRAHENSDADGAMIAEYAVSDENGQAGADDLSEVDAERTLQMSGWEVTSRGWDSHEDGFVTDIAPTDWEAIVRDAKLARNLAEQAATRAESAWRHVVRLAMPSENLGASSTAAAAGVTRGRVYQIRDGRR